jgi:hypothetical protein
LTKRSREGGATQVAEPRWQPFRSTSALFLTCALGAC